MDLAPHESNTLKADGSDVGGWDGPVLVQVSKCGPAFETPLAVDLARSLQAQALVPLGEVLSYARAIEGHKDDRRNMKKLLAAWARVRQIIQPDIRHADISRLGWMTRQGVARDIQTAVHLAMRHAGDAQAIYWQQADMIVRGAAQREVLSLDEQLVNRRYEDGSAFPGETVEVLEAERAWFQQHAEGRA